MIKTSFGRKVFLFVNGIIMILFAAVCLIPVLHVFNSSLSDPYALSLSQGLVLWPKGFSLEGYKAVLRAKDIWRGYGNTIMYVVLQTVLGVLFTSLGAYALSREKLMLKNPIMLMISFTMMFSGGLIPTYLLMNKLGLLETIWAVVIPGCISPMNLVIMRTFFTSIPKSLEESAKLDGAGHWRILFQIYYPLAKASLAVVALFIAVAQWNSYFGAMIYLSQSRELWPLQLVLKELIATVSGAQVLAGEGMASIDTVLLTKVMNNAVIVAGSLPIFLLYPFMQKYFVKGVMIGSLKG